MFLLFNENRFGTNTPASPNAVPQHSDVRRPHWPGLMPISLNTPCLRPSPRLVKYILIWNFLFIFSYRIRFEVTPLIEIRSPYPNLPRRGRSNSAARYKWKQTYCIFSF